MDKLFRDDQEANGGPDLSLGNFYLTLSHYH